MHPLLRNAAPISRDGHARGSAVTGPASILIGAASLAILAMHAYLGSYSRFMADDYCSAAEQAKFGILRAAWFWYRTWTGRYSANVLDALSGKLGTAFTPAVTSLVLFSWLVALAAAVFMLMRTLSGTSTSPIFSVAVSAAIISLTLELAPNVSQSLYWGQGMRSIIPPLILMIAYVAVFFAWRHRVWSTRGATLWFSIFFLFAFGTGGFSETFTALQLAAFALALAICGLTQGRALSRHDFLFLCAGLLGSIFSFITVILSPGNAARAAFYPPAPAIPALLAIAWNSYGLFFQNMFGSAFRLLSIVASLALGLWAGASFDWGIRRPRVALAVLFLGAILIFCCFPPAAYGESDAPPDRTLLIPTFLLVVTLVILGISLGSWLGTRLKFLAPLSNVAMPLMILVAALSIYQMSALQPQFASYATAWSKFTAEMVSARKAGAASLHVSTADMNANNWAGLNVIGDNPRFWLNKCISDYYGVSVTSVTP